jgi:predicted O-linked N-acetylglucosamine transferase (SPINDLY family)
MQSLILSEYIHKILSIRYPKLSTDEKHHKIKIIFKQLINGIRDLTTTNELDAHNTPMGFLFQHIRIDIIKCVATCSPSEDYHYFQKTYSSNNNSNNIAINTSSTPLICYTLDWNIRLFNRLVWLNAKDIIIWYFLQIPYYIENEFIQNKIRILYEQLLNYFLEHWPSNFLLTEEEFIFISNETCLPYAIAYHNKINTNILAKYSKLIRKIAPWVNYYSPRLAEAILKQSYSTSQFSNTIQSSTSTNYGSKKRRVCFITDSFSRDSSVLRDRIGIIGKLDATKFDVYIAGFVGPEQYKGILADVFIRKYKSVYIHLASNFTDARKQLEALELDIIIYPDLGMKLLPTLLAYSRIAKYQITTWGHSETSGIDTIDYYISSSIFEDTTSSNITQSHYTEKIILFKSLGTYYFSPHKIFIENNPSITQPYIMKTREELGLPSSGHLYCCLQTFYKMSPDFEIALARILQLDREAIILLSNGYPYCKSHLARLRQVIGIDNIARIRWLPGLEKPEFLNVVSVCDICLDPFPFGGCNTTYEAIDYNIPVVTKPSEFLHGRFTLGLYKKMNMLDCECITSTGEEYAQIAARIAMNVKLKHKLQRAIESGKEHVFQEKASVDEWNSFLATLY